jgi:NTP pyrophosphatase (non-canonical NTP hydrolase)
MSDGTVHEPIACASERRAFLKILTERRRQDAKWGEQNHADDFWMLILMEEVGETAQAILQACEERGSPARTKEELIQVAAVAVAWLEAIERRGEPDDE